MRRIKSSSIVDDRRIVEEGVPISESVTSDHQSLRERPHWNGSQ